MNYEQCHACFEVLLIDRQLKGNQQQEVNGHHSSSLVISLVIKGNLRFFNQKNLLTV